MARLTYLERRGATYYARIDIPVDLVPLYRTTTRKKSLRTKDEATAKTRLWPVVQAWQAEFNDVRARRELTTDDKAAAVWQHYTGTLERDEQARLHADDQDQDEFDRPTAQSLRRFEAHSRRVKLDVMRKHLVIGETALIDDEVDDYLERNKLIIDPASPDRADIARRMMRGEIEALQRTIERDQGDYSGTPKDPIVRPATGTSRETAKPGEGIMELFEQYAAENPKGIAVDTIAQARRDVGSFVDYVGSTCPVHRIDKKAVREWKALLLKYPVKATESSAFAGMKLAQIVKHNETIGKPAITPRTVNRYLAGFSAFCSWLVNHGYLDHNPADGMFLKKTKDKTTIPFTVDQMNTMFKSPLFTGCQSADEWRNVAKPGNVMIRDHRYWVPLVMLYSGARPAEIAQLSIADVRQEHGCWILHITTEGDGDKSVKTEGSMRVVPVHDELIRLGFIKYRDGMEAAGHARLFPEAKRNSRGQMIAEFSREFGRYLTRLGMKTGRGLSLYSFRHGATDALRRAGHLDEQFGFILGHTAGSMTGRYGIMPQGMLKQRVDLVNSISYPGLDLSFLVAAVSSPNGSRRV
ncbi:MAG: site-specific integrase [Mesorhizobium sp.]|uniref:site-specific integrase n=1 Tax=Mesorhizobium sp. TaxID=1871066 RepID=UPI000FE9B747|nr:site-specific integrase [Mesorhizobium sp.]RWD50558.1 MAG: site-specific integrase [Mesorhizobium sp.]RWE55772.1 MAG: site-specific integrase [Mesorhizobium sp.]RWF09677.1 MAG: site-specific integrase [Mesorhizobium sp.]RWF20932.1 MAG: site-specific integrase [Mesorhizobium sp.]TIX86344.1 MAG: site-specific integrase [Mesorhizobium sp.]